MEAQRPELFAGFVHLAPQIVAGKTDMLPAQRRDMCEQFVWRLDTDASQMPDGAVKIEGIPECDGCGEQGLPGGAMALVFESAVAQFAQAVEEDGTGERVAGLALVEDGAGTTPLLRIVEPVEQEQGALNPPDLAQRAGDRVLTRKACQLSQHDRCADRADPDRGGEPQRFLPVFLDRANVDRTGR